jgi:outer membrane receptor protein involved in Fe transport
LRFEYTGITPSLSTGSSVYSQSHYSNLLPSVSIQRNLSPASNISLDYSERIKRPGIWQINPFVDRSNPLFIKIGNPALQPIVMHVIDINYNYYKKASLTANLSYSSSNNSFEEVAQIKTDSTTVFTYLNTSLLQQLDLSLSGSFPISPKFTISYNHLFTYVKLAGNVNSKKITNSGFQGDFYASVRYNLAKGFNMSLDGGGETRYILLQGKDNYYPYVSLSAAKEVFNKKGMITFLLQNPFTKLLKVDFYTNGPGFSQYSYNNFYHRAIAIKFRYSFGKSRTSIKKANQQIINDDIKQKSK